MNQFTLSGKPLFEVAKKPLNFSYRDYYKLEKDSFSTIRKKRFPKSLVGKIVTITINREPLFCARVLAVEYKPLQDLETSFLIEDTTRHAKPITTREQAIALLQSFYRNAITPATEFSVITLEKLDVMIVDGEVFNRDCFICSKFNYFQQQPWQGHCDEHPDTVWCTRFGPCDKWSFNEPLVKALIENRRTIRKYEAEERERALQQHIEYQLQKFEEEI